jgi:hypothetical protein
MPKGAGRNLSEDDGQPTRRAPRRRDLSVAVEGGSVIVERGGARRYRAEAEPPVWLTREMLEIRLANGVLELSAPRPEGAA